jgi:hypothetical protein
MDQRLKSLDHFMKGHIENIMLSWPMIRIDPCIELVCNKNRLATFFLLLLSSYCQICRLTITILKGNGRDKNILVWPILCAK